VESPTEECAEIVSGADDARDRTVAALYALDAKTGKTLYQSGNIMTTWAQFSGLAVTDGRVYAIDHDSDVYCFGLKGEKRKREGP
jgi:outer membrane protein assembly factor BamB